MTIPAVKSASAFTLHRFAQPLDAFECVSNCSLRDLLSAKDRRKNSSRSYELGARNGLNDRITNRSGARAVNRISASNPFKNPVSGFLPCSVIDRGIQVWCICFWINKRGNPSSGSLTRGEARKERRRSMMRASKRHLPSWFCCEINVVKFWSWWTIQFSALSSSEALPCITSDYNWLSSDA